MGISAPTFDNSISVKKSSNAFGYANDWFEELLKKIQEKREEQKRLEIKKQRDEFLNIKI